MGKILNKIMYIFSYPGYGLYKALKKFEDWNGPELIAIGSVGYCIYLLITAGIQGFESVWHLFKLSALLTIALMFSLFIARFVLNLLFVILNPFYTIHCDCIKREGMMYAKKEMTLDEYVEKMRHTSPYGLVRGPR